MLNVLLWSHLEGPLDKFVRAPCIPRRHSVLRGLNWSVAP